MLPLEAVQGSLPFLQLLTALHSRTVASAFPPLLPRTLVMDLEPTERVQDYLNLYH